VRSGASVLEDARQIKEEGRERAYEGNDRARDEAIDTKECANQFPVLDPF
jgi:hypothetical protein